jgi:hypothetical protein
MAEISEVCGFEVDTEKVFLQTNQNGDTITIAGIHLDANDAASLGWLLNGKETIKVKIKAVG